MKLIDKTVQDFTNEVDKKSATPGGGSVSALVASMGASLLRMTGHLTIHKKKFANLDETIQTSFMESFEQLKTIKDQLLELVDEDTLAYDQVMQAFRLPKDTKEEKETRHLAIQEATKVAIQTPFEMMETALKGMKQIKTIITYGNKNTISDIGVAAIMLFGAIKGAQMNVLINLDMLEDTELSATYNKESETILHEAKIIYDDILETVYQSF